MQWIIDGNMTRLQDRLWGHDLIENFETGIDKIDLSQIDANTGLAGNQAFVFTTRFTGRAGQLIYNDGQLRGDTNGDRIADLTINVDGLSRSDVIL